MTPFNSLLSRRSLLSGGLALSVAACGRRAATGEAAQPASKTAAPAAAAAPAPAGEEAIVTVLGDSITAGLGLPSAQALPVQLEAVLTSRGVKARVRAAGVSGDTTAGGLARVDFSVQNDTDVCVVALGGNDLLQGIAPERIRANLDAIVTRLKARGITVVLAGMRGPPQFGTYTAAFDRVFPDLAAKHGVLLYPFLLQGVALVERYNQADGIHPNAEGARLIAEGLAPVVAAAISTHLAKG